jgi:hypothetical protein
MPVTDRWISDELEILVQERTAGLERANQLLRAENIESKRAEEHTSGLREYSGENGGVAGAI